MGRRMLSIAGSCLCAVALCAPAAAPAPRPAAIFSRTVTVKVPGDDLLRFSLVLQGYTPLPAEGKPDLRRVMHGELVPNGPKTSSVTLIEVLADRDAPHRTSAEWCASREQIVNDARRSGRIFKFGEISCVESQFSLGGGEESSRILNYQAFVVDKGWCFEIRLTSSAPSKPVNGASTLFSREDFLGIVRSAKVKRVEPPPPEKPRATATLAVTAAKAEAAVKQLQPASKASAPTNPFGITIPPPVAALERQALARGAQGPAWIAAQCAERPDEYAPHYVAGQLGEPAGYERASELLAQLTAPTPGETALRMLSENGLGRSLFAEGKLTEAGAHLVQAWELSQQAASPGIGELAYDLARCSARAGLAGEALHYLEAAIALDSDLRQRAEADPSYGSLREDAAFKKLVGA